VIRQITFFRVRRNGQGALIDQYNAEFHPEETKKPIKKRSGK
jgi:hypothetical protein